MDFSDNFKELCKNIKNTKIDDYKTTAGEIAKKLNKAYYNSEQDTESHMYFVGSVGRRTSIANSSDLDLLFVLPAEAYTRFNAYNGNGQSALLQEVKNVITERYPSTEISGDGQVVVIAFSKYTVELVPAFEDDDGKFIYPDTHEGGSWKKTDPLTEQDTCKKTDDKSNSNYLRFCRIMRCWKDEQGVSINGLLIDTFVYNVFNSSDYYKDKSYSSYHNILRDVFKYISEQSRTQEYWIALGSGQYVYNKDKGRFVGKAKRAYLDLNNAIETDDCVDEVVNDLLGSDFPTNDDLKNKQTNSKYNRAPNEEFYYEKFKVDIRFWLKLDCEIGDNYTYSGETKSLIKLLEEGRKIDIGRKLTFKTESTNCPAPYKIYWKVRNRGPEAKKRNMERGAIEEGTPTRKEHSDFVGPHYVECYLVKNGTCVAKDRISVPIF